MAEFRLRDAELSDREPFTELVLGLRSYLAGLTPGLPPPDPAAVAGQVRKYLEDPYHLVILALDGEKAVGFARVMAKQGNDWLRLRPKRRSDAGLVPWSKDRLREFRDRLRDRGREKAAGPLYVYLADLYVRPEARRQGLGKTLFERALAAPGLETAAAVYLNVLHPNELGRRFWTALGFVPDTWVMAKKLPPKTGVK